MDAEQAILKILASRGAGKSICPSEAARLMQPDDWRPLMDEVRSAAARLAIEQKITVTQKEQTVDPLTAKGPIRLRLTSSP